VQEAPRDIKERKQFEKASIWRFFIIDKFILSNFLAELLTKQELGL